MVNFDDLWASATPHFMIAFGQTITILVSGAADRSVSAIVDWDPDAELSGQAGRGIEAAITVKNSATAGIAASEFLNGKFRAVLPIRPGGTADAAGRPITRILQQDEEMVKYQVR